MRRPKMTSAERKRARRGGGSAGGGGSAASTEAVVEATGGGGGAASAVAEGAGGGGLSPADVPAHILREGARARRECGERVERVGRRPGGGATGQRPRGILQQSRPGVERRASGRATGASGKRQENGLTAGMTFSQAAGRHVSFLNPVAVVLYLRERRPLAFSFPMKSTANQGALNPLLARQLSGSARRPTIHFATG